MGDVAEKKDPILQAALTNYQADLIKEGGGKELALKNAKESFMKRANQVKISTGPNKGKTAVEVYQADYEKNKPQNQ